jgi:hypothetical protein
MFIYLKICVADYRIQKSYDVPTSSVAHRYFTFHKRERDQSGAIKRLDPRRAKGGVGPTSCSMGLEWVGIHTHALKAINPSKGSFAVEDRPILS